MRARSDNGEYTISQRKDGLYYTTIELPSTNGKRNRQVITGKTRKVVATKLKQALADKEAGVSAKAGKQTTAQFLETWLEQVVKVRRSARTHESYSMTAHEHIIPVLGTVKLAHLTPEHILQLQAALLAKGLGRTTQYAQSVLSRALNVAVKWGYITRNVASLVDRYQPRAAETQALTPQQVQALLDAAKGTSHELPIRVAIVMGLRIGELCALRWEDMDLECGLLHIRTSVQRRNSQLHRTAPKTPGSVRTLHIPQDILRAFVALRASHEAIAVFTHKGKYITPDALRCQFKRLLHKAGLPHSIRFHDLRKTCATLLAANGVNPKIAMHILGHSNVQTTLQVYTKSQPDMEASALDGLANMF